jgi:hypothetical protein
MLDYYQPVQPEFVERLFLMTFLTHTRPLVKYKMDLIHPFYPFIDIFLQKKSNLEITGSVFVFQGRYRWDKKTL